MQSEDDSAVSDEGTLAFYLDTREGELPDLEVAALAAIHWAKGLKAAAIVFDPSFDYRVRLVATKPGSSNWIARIEQSSVNQSALRLKDGWRKIPVIVRMALGLAVVVPTTAVPTLDFYLGDGGFTDQQKKDIEEIYRRVASAPDVSAHRKAVYKTCPSDPSITGIGTGVPTSENWKPVELIPSNQFAEASGLFSMEEEGKSAERTVYQTLSVVLVTPRLENARRAWTFRQEGIPGTFNAEMTDENFLHALERVDGVRETLRANIQMQIKLEIDQEKVNGEWKVKRRGRRVIEVISPPIE